jgi:hypothetical protein
LGLLGDELFGTLNPKRFWVYTQSTLSANVNDAAAGPKTCCDFARSLFSGRRIVSDALQRFDAASLI